MSKQNKRFITLEGTEGAGKSSVLSCLAEVLQEYQLDFLATREPGGTQSGEKIRQVFLSSENVLHADTELLLLTAARSEHLDKVVKPGLAEGRWVLSDRFIDASFAYQGGGRGVALTRIERLTNWLGDIPTPGLTFLLDLSPEIGLQRIVSREHDRIEKEKIVFFERVRQHYLEIAEKEPQRVVVVNAEAPFSEVKQVVRDRLIAYIESL